jgi:hypothetical protein
MRNSWTPVPLGELHVPKGCLLSLNGPLRDTAVIVISVIECRGRAAEAQLEA